MDFQNNKKMLALVGPPNSGKTTLFNWLTGFKNQTINYPGSTVFISSGKMQEKYSKSKDEIFYITDTPGCYSLFPKSADEEVTKKYLFDKKNNIEKVICVLDGSKLPVQLPLFFQLKEAGFSIVVVLSMWDLISQRQLDLKKLEQELGVPVIPINGLLGAGVWELTESFFKPELNSSSHPFQKLKPWSIEKITEVSKTSQALYKKIDFKNQKHKNLFISKRFDKFFLSPKFGLFFLCLVMFSLFSSLFWLADPFMTIIDESFSFLIDKIYQWKPESLVTDFIANGVLASFGAVFVFVPQIFILFLGISFLEDTGYLARASALLDGPFSKIGLTGRAFVPFLSGYACAVPAAMATRSLSSHKEKIMTFFAIPFMSCSARLPVYALLLSALFYGQSAWKLGAALSVIYLSSFFLGIFSVALLNSFIKTKKQRPFLIDLPIYRRPALLKTFQVAWKKTTHYIFKAGPAIFIVALLVWVMTSFPRNLNFSDAEQIQKSYAGQLGQWIEPLFHQMGVDWRVGVALIAAFAAREVFVSVLVLIFNITAKSETAITSSLLDTLKTATNLQGDLIFSVPSIVALIVFFMVALQCVSTTAIIYKESHSFKLASLQLISLNVLAYLLAVITYQSLNWIL